MKQSREIKGPHSPKMHCEAEFRVTQNFQNVCYHRLFSLQLDSARIFNPPV